MHSVISYSPDVTTNSKTTNPNFQGFFDPFNLTLLKRFVNSGFGGSELVVGSGEKLQIKFVIRIRNFDVNSW